MAFVIPSKNIYNKDNDKIRDNKIDRIEVGAFEIVPNNEYETPVYNENIKSPNFNEEKKHNLKYEKYTYLEEDSAAEYEDYIGIYAGITAKYTNIDISIPKLSNNNLISNLLLEKDNESKIGINLICEVKYYSVTADYDTATNTISNIKRTENEQKRETKNNVNIQEIFSKQNGEKGYLYFSKSENKYGVYGGTVSIETNIKDNNNILRTSYDDENESYKIRGLNILSGATGLGLSGHSGDYDYIPLTGDEVDYTPIQVEITIYGNTIGIDLKDKTVYVPSDSGNKPFSVEGNELLQTTNYIEDKNYEQIENIYKNTLNHYKNGKETATILCSIDDYKSTYQYNNAQISYFVPINSNFAVFWVDLGEPAKEDISICFSVNGKKYYSVCKKDYSRSEDVEVPKDNQELTTKIIGVFQPSMVFQQYDIVIPMVYSARQTDSPMSKYKDGLPKEFEVLSSKLIYDGAVWQELILQETL